MIETFESAGYRIHEIVVLHRQLKGGNVDVGQRRNR